MLIHSRGNRPSSPVGGGGLGASWGHMRLGLWVLKGDWCSGLRLASTLVPGLGPSGPLAVSWGQQRAPGPPGSHILLSQVTSLPLWVWQVVSVSQAPTSVCQVTVATRRLRTPAFDCLGKWPSQQASILVSFLLSKLKPCAHQQMLVQFRKENTNPEALRP